ncbi:hypothetical protein [Kallotenue papyrolyticum]|nr:hypothetical protein [Kallotenue papyrolyticum]
MQELAKQRQDRSQRDLQGPLPLYYQIKQLLKQSAVVPGGASSSDVTFG